MLLSILIPTYNRAKLAYRAVMSAIKHLENDIEIVACDNCSEDGTYELLNSIEDKRLRVLRNNENKYFHGNVLRLLKEAEGDFSLLLGDEDTIIEEGLKELLIYLQQNPDIAVVSCEIIKENGDFYLSNNNCTLNSGFESYYKCYRLGYVSGIVYNKKYIDFSKEYVFEYPNIDIALQICHKNKMHLLKKPVIMMYMEKSNFSDTATHSIKGTANLVYSPKGRKLLFEKWINKLIEKILQRFK